MKRSRWARRALLAALTLAAPFVHAACPNGSSFDNALGFCADASNAYGPFTQAMTSQCTAAGGGPACSGTSAYVVGTTTVNIQRWSRSFAQGLRGTGACPNGSVPDGTLANRCVEGSGSTQNVFGPFPDDLISQCVAKGGGPACYTNRWSASFYRSLTGAQTPTTNKLGVWLFQITSSGHTHAQLADKLKGLGVKRIFIKIADGTTNCAWFPDACSTTTTDTYKSRGIEPWAWSYNYPGSSAAQAQALTLAAQYGYQGYIVDIEKEFNGLTTELNDLMAAFSSAQAQARAKGWIKGSWYFADTSWGNPKSNNMHVEIMDKYVDAHMPQSYLDIWGSAYPSNPKYWIGVGNCEYRALGANKPIWHIASNETGTTSSSLQDAFFKAAGPNASLWIVPGGSVPQSQWSTMAAMNWTQTSWDTTTDCSAGNYEVSGKPVPTPAPSASCPDGAAFDTALGFCADASNAYGPFTAAMTTACAAQGGGSTCSANVAVAYANNTVSISEPRWSKAFAKGLRGTSTCPNGATVGDSRFGGHCVEGTAPSGNPLNVFGPFDSTLIQTCQSNGGGLACLQQRWSADFYLKLKGYTTPSTSFPYYDQNDNQNEGWRACNITSIGMALDFFGITKPPSTTNGLRTPDYLYNLYGISGSPATLANMFNAEAVKAGSAVRDTWTNTGTFSQLRSIVQGGKPVVIHGWFTASGHVVEVIGWDGANYIVNDPDGLWDGVWKSTNYDTSKSGKAVKYPAAKFEAAITDNGLGNDLLMHVFQ